MPDVTPAEIHDLTRRALMAQGASAAVADGSFLAADGDANLCVVCSECRFAADRGPGLSCCIRACATATCWANSLEVCFTLLKGHSG